MIMPKFLDDAGLGRLSGLLRDKLSGKQDKLTGAPGQVVGFDAAGRAVAQEAVTMEAVETAVREAVAGAIEEGY